MAKRKSQRSSQLSPPPPPGTPEDAQRIIASLGRDKQPLDADNTGDCLTEAGGYWQGYPLMIEAYSCYFAPCGVLSHVLDAPRAVTHCGGTTANACGGPTRHRSVGPMDCWGCVP